MKEKYTPYNLSLNNIIDILGEDEKRDQGLLSAVGSLLREHGNAVYRDAVYHIAHLDLPPAESRRLWRKILSHKRNMGRKLSRNVGIRVAALDYFLHVEKRIDEPKIIETALLEEIQAASGKDALTGLPNYSSFKDRMRKEMSRSQRYKKVFSLIVFDIDSFKKYNDTHGHKEGDVVLRKISQCLEKCVRESDFVGRYGGEEFVAILVETNKKRAAAVAERIRKTVSAVRLKETVTISGGIASFPVDARKEDDLFTFADKALYKAKAEGKNRICLFYRERRRFIRLGTAAKISISRISKRLAARADATAVNISAGGIAFHYHEPVPISSLVEALVHLRHGQDIPFKGKIVRVEETRQESYEIAVRFLRIKKEDRQRMMEFIEKHREP